MDVYSVGTLLECMRVMATALAVDGKRVKVCVQVGCPLIFEHPIDFQLTDPD
jgi:hypothetical protein